MYEYLLENLINYSQVYFNLRRAADKGLVSDIFNYKFFFNFIKKM